SESNAKGAADDDEASPPSKKNIMKKLGFGPLLAIILLCAIALTSAAASDAASNKISAQERRNMKFEASENNHNYLNAREGLVVHRRARPNQSSHQPLKKHPFFIFGFMSLIILIQY
ncbi:hypothetical protein HAX54_046093, partial [Datura stramonium]|nr:hypothetical protein [Datura stramonium]